MQLIAVGDNITDCYPEFDLMFPGGNCVNVAVHAARLGTTTSYLGSVGDDDRGRQLVDALRSEHMNISHLRIQPGSTGYATVLHEDGERTFGPFDRGASRVSLVPTDFDFVAQHAMAHSSYAAQLEADIPELAERAPVSFDFDAHTGDDYAQQLMPSVSYAFFSASHFAAKDIRELLSWACGSGASSALATRGAQGAIYFDGTTFTTQPARRALVRDTLGAGDAFVAAVLHGILTGQAAPVFLARAATLSASVCENLGAFGHSTALSAGQHLPVPLLPAP
ncbi:MAG: PfkB family carbohydrate kinase [Nakamurella sp.]